MTNYDLAILAAVIAGILAVLAVNARLPNLAKAAPEAVVIIAEYIGAFMTAFVILGSLVFGLLYAARWVYRFITG